VLPITWFFSPAGGPATCSRIGAPDRPFHRLPLEWMILEQEAMCAIALRCGRDWQLSQPVARW
jgi:hypothetical protein